MADFCDLGLDPAILQALIRMGYKAATPIQTEAIPLILENRDVIALAQTGSGKTAACAIPICHMVDVAKGGIQGLIIVPTRELALQYATEVQKIGFEKGVKAFAILGGESIGMQEAKLKSGVHVLVATPGRLIDLIYNRLIDLTSVKTLVLDEADEMLSMGFYDDLEFIIQCLVQEHQTLLFSATMPAAIRRIAEQHMHQPHEVTLTAAQSSPKHLEHRFVYCQARERDQQLVALLQELQPEQGLIFSHSRQHCETLCHLMQRHFDRVDYLHAGLSQEVRSAITNKFRQGKIRYLVATDVAARGLDFSRITHVFIYQLAPDPEVYIHRAGRAGRCDRIGTCITLITERELHTLHKVLALLRREATWIGAPPPPKGARRHHSAAPQKRISPSSRDQRSR